MEGKGDKMNFHDKVYEVLNTFKQTTEYQNFIMLKNELKKDDATYQMLRNFKEMQNKHQMEFISTGKKNESVQKELENLYSILIQNEKARNLLECEMRLNILLADMQKIMAEGMKEIVEF